jgi:hypothetical protein
VEGSSKHNNESSVSINSGKLLISCTTGGLLRRAPTPRSYAFSTIGSFPSHQLLAYADDVNLLGDDIDTIKETRKL